MCLASAYWARISRIVYANTRDDAAAIGFDDAFIYEELRRPPQSRRIPMIQLMREESLALFDAWNRQPGKAQY